MSTNRVKQIFLGFELSDAELEDIPSPRMELHAHVMTKFVQMSSILGASIIGPLVGLKRGRSIAAAFRAVPLVRNSMFGEENIDMRLKAKTRYRDSRLQEVRAQLTQTNHRLFLISL